MEKNIEFDPRNFSHPVLLNICILNNKVKVLTKSESALKNTVQADLILSQSI